MGSFIQPVSRCIQPHFFIAPVSRRAHLPHTQPFPQHDAPGMRFTITPTSSHAQPFLHRASVPPCATIFPSRQHQTIHNISSSRRLPAMRTYHTPSPIPSVSSPQGHKSSKPYPPPWQRTIKAKKLVIGCQVFYTTVQLRKLKQSHLIQCHISVSYGLAGKSLLVSQGY